MKGGFVVNFTRFKDSLVYLQIALLLLVALLPQVCPISSEQTEEFTYYGLVPSMIYIYRPERIVGGEILGREFTLDENSIRTEAELVTIGNHDDTRVRVYQLPSGVLLEDFSLNRFAKHVSKLQNGTFFKAVSSKPATMILMGGEGVELGNDAISTFWTSTDGGFVGKEFIFQAVQGKLGSSYYVYALENSEVKLLDDAGEEVASYTLKANEAKNLMGVTQFRIYGLSSTGMIMLQSFTESKSVFFPSPKGGFLGETWYGYADATPGDVSDDWQFLLIVGSEDTKARIINLEFSRLYEEVDVPAFQNFTMKIEPNLIAVETDDPVTVMHLSYGHPFKSNYVGGGLLYIGVKAGQAVPIYFPEESEAYLFAQEESLVDVDGARLKLEGDDTFALQPGVHTLSADRNIVIAMALRPLLPPNQGLYSFGACIPSIQSIGYDHDVNLQPLLAAETPWTLILGGTAGACAIIIAAWIIVSRKRQK